MVSESTTGNYQVSVKGEIVISVKEVIEVGEDGVAIGASRIEGSISGDLKVDGGSYEANNVTYTAQPNITTLDTGRDISSWTSSEDYLVNVYCISSDSGGHNATLTVRVNYSIKRGDSHGSIHVTVSGLS